MNNFIINKNHNIHFDKNYPRILKESDTKKLYALVEISRYYIHNFCNSDNTYVLHAIDENNQIFELKNLTCNTMILKMDLRDFYAQLNFNNSLYCIQKNPKEMSIIKLFMRDWVNYLVEFQIDALLGYALSINQVKLYPKNFNYEVSCSFYGNGKIQSKQMTIKSADLERFPCLLYRIYESDFLQINRLHTIDSWVKNTNTILKESF